MLLVALVAAIVSFWPEQQATNTATTSVAADASDDPIRRHFDFAVTQLRTGHFEQAVNGFRAVLEQAPTMPEAYVNKGFAHIELAQFDQAQQAFQIAIDLRPGQVNAYWGLAVSLEGLCDIPGAMGAMRTYVHLAEPNDPFMAKANAALWEWGQLKTKDVDGNPGRIDCSQQKTAAQEIKD